jgi:cell division protein FtsI (penicillin-binding protein 3)
MEVRNEVLLRMYFLLFGLVLPFACLVAYKSYRLSIVEGEKWRKLGKNQNIKLKNLEANRGNIYTSDGALLATSIPYFDVFFDPVAPSDSDFDDHIDSLALLLAKNRMDGETPLSLGNKLKALRKNSKNRRLPIQRKISYTELNKLKQYPLFRLGQFKGGLIVEQSSKRRMPFNLLAQRTIGYLREGAMPVGIEGSFHNVLKGAPGSQYMLCVNRKNDIWLPLENLNSINPKDGHDVVTTIDINFQDITENALLKAMKFHEAEWGTAVVMEVKTGAIKAIANLGSFQGNYTEGFNYAIGMSVEPGSTFKAATLLAILEHTDIDLNEEVPISNGVAHFFGDKMVDVAEESKHLESISVSRAFEISSNVGMARTLGRYFSGTPDEPGKQSALQFIQALEKFNLHHTVQNDIEGEAQPYFKRAYNSEDNWSGTTLPWMAIGYELSLTPLQLLNFFNAIANDGKLMRPFLVKGVQNDGAWIQEFTPDVVKRRIAGTESIAKMQELLRNVVVRGTAKKLSTSRFSFAGKTGTAQTDYQRLTANETHQGGYRASFVGYFPAENPAYSCIVVIHNPMKNGYYGSDVAGPVFREIADKIYFSSTELQPAINQQEKPVLVKASLPGFDFGNSRDIQQILSFLEIPSKGQFDPKWAVLQGNEDFLDVKKPDIQNHKIPSVLGAGLKDALFLLENKGLRVTIEGVGKVVHQSVRPGTKTNGQTLHLILR